MAEYIEREAAIEEIALLARERFTLSDIFEAYLDSLKDADTRIRSIPAADVAPVRHGRWIDKGFQDMVCSACGNDAAAGYDEEPWPTPYCPFCGAKMDGDAG